jgi:uncharacterized membrane protein YecN with MAPEG domain
MISVSITAFFAAVLALIQVVFTLRVGAYRFANSVSLGDGGDGELLKRMRAHGNFVETVPMALLLLLINEIGGMSSDWLYALGATLVVARLLHYAGIAFKVPLLFRMVGIMGTLLVIVIAAIQLLM